MKNFKFWVMMLVVVFSLSLLAACNKTSEGDSNEGSKDSKNNAEENKEEVVVEEWDHDAEPTVVKVLYPWGEDAFQAFIVDVVKDELPENITLECICGSAKFEALQDMNAAGITPDIMLVDDIEGIDPIAQLDMLEPIDDYVALYGVDLDELNQSVLATYRAMDPEGEGRLIGLPTFVDTVGLVYNKDVFDLFGVNYPDPEVALTWDEVRDLAIKMTGERNGVFYRGLEMGAGFTDTQATFPLREFGINLTDPETGEVLITESPEMKQYLELILDYYSIPGLYDPSDEARHTDKFAEKTVAMTTSWPAYLRWGLGGDPETLTSIDVAPIPVWEKGGKGPQVYAHPYVLNKYSENKKAGFQTMLAIARVNAIDPLQSPYSEFGPESENHVIYEGKNMQAFWNYEGALPPEVISKWDKYVDIHGSLHKLGEGSVDINVFLRVLKEESEIKIKQAMLE